jgi:hypothetical protein
MFATLVRRAAQSTPESLAPRVSSALANNPYKARKVWPPDFQHLSPQQQLRFEKKYKRRILEANRSPAWERGGNYSPSSVGHPFYLRRREKGEGMRNLT